MATRAKPSTSAVLNLGGGDGTSSGGREATHPAIIAVMETISEQIANYAIPEQGESHEDNSILDVDSFLGSLGALREHLGLAFVSVAETFDEGPVFHTVCEALRECGGADVNMADELEGVHTEWQNNPENAHDLARGRGEIVGAELFNV